MSWERAETTLNVLVRLRPESRDKLNEMAKADPDHRAPVYILSNIVDRAYEEWKKAKHEQ
jgi:hypothetical protein